MSTIGLHRLYHQRITHAAFKDASQVVSWLGAMQGQDYAGTKWAFGLRLSGVTDLDLEQAIADGLVMRTWALRGTLHYVAPADIHWMLDLVASRQIAGNATRYKQLELDPATLVRSSSLIAEALHRDKQLSRGELLAMLEENHITTAGQRGVYMLQRAGLEQLIYQGPVYHNETTFRLLAEGKTRPRDEALAVLAHRYFTSRGPASLADFAHWSGLLISEARAGLESVKAELIETRIGDQTYFLAADIAKTPERSLYLLPGFDEFVLGYRDRSAVLDEQHADAICPGGNGMFMSTIVVGGRIIGTWKRTLKKKLVEIEVNHFRPFSSDEIIALETAVAHYGVFLGLPTKIL